MAGSPLQFDIRGPTQPRGSVMIGGQERFVLDNAFAPIEGHYRELGSVDANRESGYDDSRF
jgi:hypothetical protein